VEDLEAAEEAEAAAPSPTKQGVPMSSSAPRVQAAILWRRFVMEDMPSSVSSPELWSKEARNCPLQGYRIGQTKLK